MTIACGKGCKKNLLFEQKVYTPPSFLSKYNNNDATKKTYAMFDCCVAQCCNNLAYVNIQNYIYSRKYFKKVY